MNRRACKSFRPLMAAVLLAPALILAGCGAAAPVLPVVSIAPASATLQAGGGQQQFTATVADASNRAVVWKVNGHLGGDAVNGTISQTGLYQAPAAVPAGAVEVEAVSVANGNQSAAAKITLTPPVAIQLAPATASVPLSGTVQFQATVSNATNTQVTWAVNGTAGGGAATGTISASGLYTAPAAFPGLGTVTVTATSVADPDIQASAVVTLVQPVAVAVNPAAAGVAVGKSLTFTASVTGNPNQAVTWSVNGAAGGSAAAGTITAQGVYTAPAQVPSPPVVTVTATSVADPTKTGTAQVTVTAPVAVTVAPATATLGPNATQQFTAAVANNPNTTVNWSVNGVAGGNATVGTVSTGGLYTAPASFPGLDSVTVTATSAADPTASGSATVTLAQPVAVAVAPNPATVDLGATQQFQATVTGTGNQGVTWAVNGVAGGNATLGTIDKNGLFTAPQQLPSPAVETVAATSVADATKTGTAQVTLQVPPAAFSISPASSTLTLGKAASGTATLQVTVTPGFTHPIAFAVAGQPVNVTAAAAPATLTASGPVTLTVATDSISLAQSGVPLTVSASSTDDQGHAIQQTATVLLTITGWAGHVHTVAGGPGGVGFQDGGGADDELYATAVVSDGGNNLYFSDKRGNAFRTYSLVNQTVTTIDGNPYSFTVGEGDGMAYDPASGTVYIADGLRDRIIAFAKGSDTPTLVAGGAGGFADGAGAAAQFDYPHGLALSPDGKTLYVADTNNELIRSIDVASGAVTTIAGQHGVFNSNNGVGTAATFCQPTGLAIDPAGANLYVSDQCGYDIRQIALPSVAVTTVAGNGAPGLGDGPALNAGIQNAAALAVDPHATAKLVYFADSNEIRALRLGATPADGAVFTIAGGVASGQSDGGPAQASFYVPGGLSAAADLAGPSTTTLFVADSLNGLLRRVDVLNPLTTTGKDEVVNVTTLAGQPSHRGRADGTGTGADFSGTSTATFSQPEGIVTDGKIAYVSDSENGAIRKIDLATSQVTTVAGPGQGFADGPAASAAFFQNAGLAWDQKDNILYIADSGNGAIRKLDLNTQTVSTLAGTNAFGFVDGPGAQARFNHPFGVLLSPDNTKLYVADTGNNVIRLIDLATDTVSTVAGSGGLGTTDGPAASARFAEPNGMAWDTTGQIMYISDFENQAIRAFNLSTGQVSTLVGGSHVCGHTDGPAASASLCNPALIASDGRSLFWGDANAGLLRVLNLSTMQVESLAGQPALMHMKDGDFTEAKGELTGPVRYNGVFGIALAPDDSFILFTDKTANVIRIVN